MPPAGKTLKYTAISKAAFDSILSRYPSLVPSNLRELDALRYEEIPASVESRAKKGAYLTKDEIVKLVEWKLKHGTFRPQLLSLVQSNSAEDVKRTTLKAFSDTPGAGDEWMFASKRDAALNALGPVALKDLVKLKGIGPATASLLLSVSDPVIYPFFSDELFRWVMWDMPTSNVPGKWNRKIKYNAKEYEELLERFNKLKERLGVRAVDAEKVAWVLGKKGVDVGKGGGEELSLLGEDRKEEESDAVEDGEMASGRRGKPKSRSTRAVEVKETATANKETSHPKRGVKRKAAAEERPTEGARRSSRRKTT